VTSLPLSQALVERGWTAVFLIFSTFSKMLQHFANCWQQKVDSFEKCWKKPKNEKMVSNILQNVDKK
jgi:aspartate aminotransferase-like enzyme